MGSSPFIRFQGPVGFESWGGTREARAERAARAALGYAAAPDLDRWSFGFSSSTFACASSLRFCAAGLVQLLAGLALGLALRLLRRRDLLLDFDHRPAQDLATQARHRGVDHLGALFGNLGQERRPRRLDLL